MTWAEATKENANGASQDRVSTDANVLRSTTSNSWDPHAVWLTRVKQPRELAASRVTSNAESQVRRLPD
jgi:hypothetical protein